MYNIVDLIFHILNFSLLVALGIYLFKKYAVVKINQEMVARELMLSMLHKRLDALHKQEKHIAVAYTNQQLMYEELSRKIAHWRASVFAEQRMQMAELAVREQVVVARHQEQAAYTQQMHLQALVIPRAVDQARQELEHYFATDTRSEMYMQEIIQALHKKVTP